LARDRSVAFVVFQGAFLLGSPLSLAGIHSSLEAPGFGVRIDRLVEVRDPGHQEDENSKGYKD